LRAPLGQYHVHSATHKHLAVERVQQLRVELAGLTAKKLLQHRMLSAVQLQDDDERLPFESAAEHARLLVDAIIADALFSDPEVVPSSNPSGGAKSPTMSGEMAIPCENPQEPDSSQVRATLKLCEIGPGLRWWFAAGETLAPPKSSWGKLTM
jgi:hypothetical protein